MQETESYEIIIKELRNILNEQLEYIRAFDTKFGVLFGFLGVILSLIIHFALPAEWISQVCHLWSIILLIFGLLATIFGFLPRKHDIGLNPFILVGELRWKVKHEVQENIMAACKHAFLWNQKMMSRKSMFIHWAFWLSFIGILFLCLGRIL